MASGSLDSEPRIIPSDAKLSLDDQREYIKKIVLENNENPVPIEDHMVPYVYSIYQNEKFHLDEISTIMNKTDFEYLRFNIQYYQIKGLSNYV